MGSECGGEAQTNLVLTAGPPWMAAMSQLTDAMLLSLGRASQITDAQTVRLESVCDNSASSPRACLTSGFFQSFCQCVCVCVNESVHVCVCMCRCVFTCTERHLYSWRPEVNMGCLHLNFGECNPRSPTWSLLIRVICAASPRVIYVIYYT